MHVANLLKQKSTAKKDLCKALSLPLKKPVLGIFLDRELKHDAALNLISFLKGVTTIDVSVVLLADGGSFKDISGVSVLPYGRANRNVLLDASDMALAFSFSDIEEMLIHGVIPISLSRKEVKDYNPNHETGNGFVYKKENPWCQFAALVRARETFKFPYDWKHIVRQGLNSVCEV